MGFSSCNCFVKVPVRQICTPIYLLFTKLWVLSNRRGLFFIFLFLTLNPLPLLTLRIQQNRRVVSHFSKNIKGDFSILICLLNLLIFNFVLFCFFFSNRYRREKPFINKIIRLRDHTEWYKPTHATLGGADICDLFQYYFSSSHLVDRLLQDNPVVKEMMCKSSSHQLVALKRLWICGTPLFYFGTLVTVCSKDHPTVMQRKFKLSVATRRNCDMTFRGGLVCSFDPYPFMMEFPLYGHH